MSSNKLDEDMSEWDLVRALCEASNQAEVARLINEIDFEGKMQAQDVAVNSFLITEENVCLNIEAARKVSGFGSNALSSVLRTSVLTEIIESLKNSVNTKERTQ